MNTLQLTKFTTFFPNTKSDAVSEVGFFLDISFRFFVTANPKPI